MEEFIDDRIKNWSSILERDWPGIVIFSMDILVSVFDYFSFELLGMIFEK